MNRMPKFSREKTLDVLRTQPQIEVLIVGGGINGIGTFRDLALQGVNVLLVERNDFCSGASAASSHMIHGGIRYLENGEFRLVREAVTERNLLLENAPQYVHPLATTIPIFKRFSGLFNAPLKFLGILNKPAERGALIIKLGLMMYDAYTGTQEKVPFHRFEGRRRSLTRFPQINPDIRYTATYYDAAMHSPERLAIEVLLDGVTASSRSMALNYVHVLPSENGDRQRGVRIRDALTGNVLEVTPKLVINAAGPWIDFANRAWDHKTHFIGGTKGSHLVLEHSELRRAIADHEIFFENRDGRIVLIYPFKDKVLVGTTDIAIDDPDQARCTEEEIEYFLRMIKVVFPNLQVDRSHIIFQFSGVRPLPAMDAESTGQISRDHSIKVIEPGEGNTFPVFNLIGGKWTTFRAFAEKATDQALYYLRRERLQSTRHLPIGGGRNYPQTGAERNEWLEHLMSQTELPRDLLDLLFERYGTKAADIAQYIADAQSQTRDPDLLLQFCTGTDYCRGEIQFLMSQEAVRHLDDLILRRTLLAMHGHLSHALLLELAQLGSETLGWTQEKQAQELKRVVDLLADQHGVELV